MGFMNTMEVPTCTEKHIFQTEANEKRQTEGSPRRVSFLTAEVVAEIMPLREHTASEQRSIWYTQSEIEQFRNEARDVCRAVNAGETAEEIRGLELRLALPRQKRKLLSLRCVVLAQQRISNPVQLGMLSSKCTAWAKEVALLDGQRDYCVVYAPNHPTLLAEAPKMTDFPIPIKSKKRSATGAAVAMPVVERRVRQRGAA